MLKKLSIFTLIFLLIPTLLFGATYYVKNGGDDGKDGLSDANAWATINKVNISAFNAGDYILFKRGGIWREQLTFPSSGSSGNPIVIGNYDTGELPIICGADLISSWTEDGTYPNVWNATVTTNPNQVWFNSVVGTLKASKAALSALRDYYWESNVLSVYCTSNPSTYWTSPGVESANRTRCILISNKNYVTIDGLVVEKSYSHGYLAIRASAGGSCIGAVVKNCVARYNAVNGITTYGYDWSNKADSPVWNNNACYNNGAGLYLVWTTGATVTNNYSYNNTITSSFGEGYGLGNTACITTTIANNTFYDNRLAGYEEASDGSANRPTGSIIRYNYIYNNAPGTPALQGGGLYNSAGDNAQIYYNVITGHTSNSAGGDPSSGIFVNGTGNVVYNNVLYNNRQNLADMYATSNTVIKNNIFYSPTVRHIRVQGASNTDVIDYNCYYPDGASYFEWKGTGYNFANWKTQSSQDAHSINQDPSFVNLSGSYSQTIDFKLKTDSPCLNIGTPLGLTPDFFGTSVPKGVAPEIGFYEWLESKFPHKVFKRRR